MAKRVSFLLAATFLFMTACSGDIASEILGTWECARLKQTLTFDHDNGIELTDRKTGYGHYTGTYSLAGKNLTIQLSRFSRPVVRTVQNSGTNKLVLLDGNGVKEVYLRKE